MFGFVRRAIEVIERLKKFGKSLCAQHCATLIKIGRICQSVK
jgi:hypothetical protein